nr:MAG TPA: hypothetical protein [Caudoviricetes sp.]
MIFSININTSPTKKLISPSTKVCCQLMCLVGFFSYLPIGFTPFPLID